MANKEQREGLARVFDTLSASSIIGIVVGLAGYGSISLRDIALLSVAILPMLMFSWFLRRTPK